MRPFEARDLCLTQAPREAAQTFARHGVDLSSLDALLSAIPDGCERGRDEVVQLEDAWGRPSEMAVHVPPLHRPVPLGVIVGLHGVGGAGPELAPNLRQLADACGAVLLCPTAREPVEEQSNFDLMGIFGSRFRGPRWTFGTGDLPMRALRWAREHLMIDPDRCALIGTSMGGIATWNLAARHWDQLNMAAPINGAPSIWEVFGPDRKTRELLANLLPLPVTVVHGRRDSQIPLALAEQAVERLTALGHRRISLTSVPDGEHRLSTMGFVAGNPQFDVMVRCFRAARRVRWPVAVRHSADRAEGGSAHWIAIQDIEPGHTGQVDARVTDRSRIDIRTLHVRKLRLRLSDRLVDPGRVRVVVNRAAREIRFTPSMIDAVTTFAESGADVGRTAYMVVDLDILEVPSEEGGNADAGRVAHAVDGAGSGAGGVVRAQP